jgi:hypothetical protein
MSAEATNYSPDVVEFGATVDAKPEAPFLTTNTTRRKKEIENRPEPIL